MIRITKTTIEKVWIDLAKERKHFEDNFEGDQLNRLWAVVQAAADNKWELAHTLYIELPYCGKEECPEQEFIPLWVLGDFRCVWRKGGEHEGKQCFYQSVKYF